MLELRASGGTATPSDGPHRRVRVGSSTIGAIAATRKPHVTRGHIDATLSDPAWAHRDGVVAFAGYPLRVYGNVVGVLAVYSRNQLGHDTTGALATIADSIALGIERKLSEDARVIAETELRAQAERLELINEIGKNLTSELELGPLVQRVTNLATRLAHATFGAFFYEYDPTTDLFSKVTVTGARYQPAAVFFTELDRCVVSFGLSRVVASEDCVKSPCGSEYSAVTLCFLSVATDWSSVAVPLVSTVTGSPNGFASTRNCTCPRGVT